MAAKKGKVSQKSQGKQVSGASASSVNQQPTPRTEQRGLGSSFVMAVNSLIDQAKQMSGSKNGFLGVEKLSLDAAEHGSCSHLHKKTEVKKKKK